MTRPQFDITIGKDGKLQVKVSGVSGKKCVELADMLRDIVGHEESRELTSEYYGPDGEVRIDARVQQRRST